MNSQNQQLKIKDQFREITVERLYHSRSLSYGGAGISIILVIVLLQVGIASTALYVSLLCAAISLPLWITLGQLFEGYIGIGKKSFGHLASNASIAALYSLIATGSICLAVSISALILHLSNSAFWCFIASAIVCITIQTLHYNSFSRYVSAQDSDKETNSE